MHPLRAAVLIFTLAVLMPVQAVAATLLRDADIEYALNRLAAPILQAAGLNPNRIRVLLIDDRTLNAFVADSDHIFIHSGLLLKLDRAAALQAVIAHEAAHIANGHLARRSANLRSARTAAGLGAILAAAAAAGGSGRAAAGLSLGAQSSAMRLFLSHTRAEEASADQSSVRYMVRAGVDPRGAVEVHDLFEGQEALNVGRQDPYMRTHPLSRERARAMEAFVNANPGPQGDSPSATYWFARAQGKLSAFTRAPNWTLRRAGDSPSADIALMREAVAHHRNSDSRRALAAIDRAIAQRPQDPFLYDLKGQILLESRQAGAAVAAYRKAASLAPGHPLILGGQGRALLASEQYGAALKVLEQARARDFRDARILRDLSVAYARNGQNAMASLVTAERYAVQGRLKDAGLHAKRAADLLPQGSGPWKRAQDVLRAAKLAK